MSQQQPVRSERLIKPETLDRLHAELQRETAKPISFGRIDQIHAEETDESKEEK